MAIFTPDAGATTGVNMFGFFAFTPAGVPISDIDIVEGDPEVAAVSAPGVTVYYYGPGPNTFGNEVSNVPTGGTFTSMTLVLGGTVQGTITGIDRPGNFAEIHTNNAYVVLLGDDTITGTDFGDTLFTGDEGNDTVDARGGDDDIFMAAAPGSPTHAINGGAGTDTIHAVANLFRVDRILDLRSGSIQNIEGIDIDGGVSVFVLASQISNGGLSPGAAITHQSGVGAGNGSLVVLLAQAGTANLSGFNVGTGVSIEIEGSFGDDTITGTSAGDRITGQGGNDRLYGGNGADLIVGMSNRDIMTGGADADRFDFNSRIDTSKQKGKWDVITDFTKGSDKIDFSTIDANGTKKGDPAFKFVKKEGADFARKDFPPKAGQLIWDQIDKKGTAKDVTLIQADIKGNGHADFKLELSGLIKLAATDFVL